MNNQALEVFCWLATLKLHPAAGRMTSMSRNVIVFLVVAMLVWPTPAVSAQAARDDRSPNGPGAFQDVPTGHWAEEAIGWAVANGITQGTTDGNFTPDLHETRAYTVYYLYKLYAAELSGVAGSDTFDDVPVGHWADEAIGWAVANGITAGTGDGQFSPDRPLTRAQKVTFLYRAHLMYNSAGTDSPGSDTFGDVPVGHWADEAIGWAVANGITAGTGDGLFSPDRSLTRAQAVILLQRSSTRTPHPDIPPPPARAVRMTPSPSTASVQDAAEAAGVAFLDTVVANSDLGYDCWEGCDNSLSVIG